MKFEQTEMVFILYSEINDSAIRHSLGKAEYSYFFLLKAFLPLLNRLGTVKLVENPYMEVDTIHARCQRDGQRCLFLCFSPPNFAPVNLKCPTLCVFAWEFGTIPSEPWDNDPNNDWRRVFANHGAAIACSGYTARVVKESMGEDFPVLGLPAPVWDEYAALRTQIPDPVLRETATLSVSGFVYDSKQCDYVVENLIPAIFPPLSAAPCDADPESAFTENESVHFSFKGVVYTSVLNPLDGRKCYYDIVTAFCTALRDCEDAVLLLKMTHSSADSYRHDLNHVLHQLWPFKCRVIAFNSFLERPDYQALIRSSCWYINASHCEGLCLPLLEFLSSGRPAIAPAHTAMEDYINTDLAFKIDSNIECNVWPNDTRDLYTTIRYRNDWSTLCEALLHSYQVSLNEPARYRQMSAAAQDQMQSYCSNQSVERRLRHFLHTLQPTGSAPGISDSHVYPSY